MQKQIKEQLLSAIETLQKTNNELTETIQQIVEAVIKCYENNGCVYFFGNGGSAGDAQHLAAEFVCRFKINRPAMPALALTTDTSFLTACANDYSFEDIFARQIEAFVKPADVCIGISTSGNSKNVLKGFEKAKQLGATTIGFLGCDGGKIKDFADIALIVPSKNTPDIQAVHITVGHIMCDLVEKYFYGEKK